jgi:hypothetical protein
LIGFADEAWDAIQALLDDPGRQDLADRLDAMLDILEADPGDARVRRHRMQFPRLWWFAVTGDGETWTVLWEPDDDGQPYIHYAGPGLA